MAILRWNINGTTGELAVNPGISLMEALHRLDAPVSFPCGGGHACGKCRVLAEGALSAMTNAERDLLAGAPEGTRLACFAQVDGDCSVTVRTERDDRIATDFSGGGTLEPIYDGALGAAFDIGTTTVVGYLFSRSSWRPLATVGQMNRQGRFGADVLSRIDYAHSHSVEPLRQLICTQLDEMLRELCAQAAVPTEQVSGLCVTGNTTMLHLAAGIDPYPLSQAPFTPETLFGGWYDLKLPSFPGVQAYLPRCISAYVGADITCSTLAANLPARPGTVLLVDVGTNGEMVLKTKDGDLYCCATAAGPAFEGAGISHGSSACSGAVSAVTVENGELHVTVIGGGEARSLCGSGLIDAAAALLETGAMDYRGRLRPELRQEGAPIAGTVCLTQADVRQLQLAKGAIRGGMDALLEDAGVSYDVLDEIVFCGGFGSYLNPVSAGAIGLIPPELASRTVAIGNGAGTGAGRILQDRTRLTAAANIVARARVVELSGSKSFQKRYIEAMNFPKPE